MLPGFFFHDVNDRADARAVSSIPFVALEADFFQAHEVLDTHRGVCIWWATVELELERKVLQPRHSSFLEGNPWHSAVNSEVLELCKTSTVDDYRLSGDSFQP